MSDQQTPPGGSGGNGERARLKHTVRELNRRVAGLTQALAKVREVRLDWNQLAKIGRYTGLGAALAVVAPLALEPLVMDFVKRQLMAGLRDNYIEMASTIYFRDGNTDVAGDLIDKAIETDERSAEARYLRAFLDGMDTAYSLLNLERSLTESEQNAAHRALAEAEFLINADAEDPRGHLLRGQIFMALERYEEAFDALTTARGLAHAQEDRAIEALALWRLGSTRLEWASQRGDDLTKPKTEMDQSIFKTAMDELSRSISLFALAGDERREKEARKWPRLWRGIALRTHKYAFDRAIEEFELALEEDPNFALAYYNLGEAYWVKWTSADRSKVPPDTLADWRRKSVKNFERARDADPGLAKAHFGLGLIFGSDTRYAVAKRYLDKALEIDPKYLRARQMRGRALLAMGRPQEAIADFDRAIALEPSDASLFVYRARAEIARGELTNARIDLEQAHALGGGGRFLEMTEAELSLALDMPSRALSQLEAALETARANNTASDFAEGYELRARARLARGETQAAIDAMNEAIERSTYRPERFQLAHGCLMKRIGYFPSALTSFSMALLNRPDYRPAEYAENRMLARLGVRSALPELPEGTDPERFWRLNDPYAELCDFADSET